MRLHHLLAFVFSPVWLAAQVERKATGPTTHVPASATFEECAPADVGMDADRLAVAIAFARAHGTDWPKDFHQQESMFGKLLGPMPKSRADTNGVVVRHGRMVASFGEVTAVDPTYSVAKSLLATVAAIAVRDGQVGNLDEAVGKRVADGGYDSEHNQPITWRQHLQQESEWSGVMWGKSDDFVGASAFGEAAHKLRELKAPGSYYEYNDVRINRFALSLLRVFGRAVPEVFRDEVMMPIGASATWRWTPYDTAFVELNGVKVPSVSGGTRWGGGVAISALDLARVGLLWLRSGRWGDRQILPADYVAAAQKPSGHGPDYGFLWWLNRDGKNFPGLPKNVFAARGAGNNTVFCSPDHDLVIVWRWHAGSDHADAQFFVQVIASITQTKSH